MTFDIEVHDGQITMGDDAIELFKEARRLDLRMKKNEIAMAQFKEALMKAMKENGIKSFDTEFMKAVYVPEHTAERIDTKALKAEHPRIAKKYTKETSVKESLRLNYK